MFGLNFGGILLALLINVSLGMIWYSPILFGRKWCDLIGQKTNQPSNPKTVYVVSALTACLGAVGMNILANWTKVNDPWGGILIGLLASVFPLTVNLNNAVFSNQPKALYLIDNGYPLVVYILTGILFAVWK
jgi:hypothetical protein